MSEHRVNRRGLLSEQVQDALRARIVRGELAPGVQLSEQSLSEEMAISRTPVREALIRLAEEGLVVIYPQFGSFVAPIAVDAVREAQFIREHLECAIIRDTARLIDAAGLATLRADLADQRRVIDAGDPTAFYALDETMHARFGEIAGHPRAWKVVQQSKVHMDRVRHLSVRVRAHAALLLEQHHRIVDALAAGDPDQAEAALRKHLREVLTTIEVMGLQAQPPGPPPRLRRRPA